MDWLGWLLNNWIGLVLVVGFLFMIAFMRLMLDELRTIVNHLREIGTKLEKSDRNL